MRACQLSGSSSGKSRKKGSPSSHNRKESNLGLQSNHRGKYRSWGRAPCCRQDPQRMARCRCRAKSFEGDQDGPPHVERRGPPYLLASVYIQKCLPRNGMAMRCRLKDQRIVVGTKKTDPNRHPPLASGLLSCARSGLLVLDRISA